MASYIILLLIGCGLFVQEIFSWQIAPMYHWLWLVVLGVPALGLMLFFGLQLLSKRLVDSYHWMWLMLVGVPMLCFMVMSFYLDF